MESVLLIADVAHRGAGNFGHPDMIDLRRAADFAAEHDLVGGRHRFDGNARFSVEGQKGIDDGI